MRLDFRKIDIHSFMSFDDESFDFSAHPGLTLVKGVNNDLPREKNGAGKSNVFSALLYTLFGQLQKDVTNKNVVNKYVDDKDMRLSLEFDADGQRYRVVRGMKGGRLSYLELYLFDEDITKSTIAETQEFLEREVLRCDASVFLRTVLLTSGEEHNFYKMKKADKKEFVEKLFDISVFGDMYQAIHRDILDFDKSIFSHQNRLVVLNRSETEYAERIKRHDEATAEKKARLEKLICESEAEYGRLKSLNVKRDTEETAKFDAAAKKIRTAREELSKVSAELAGKNVRIDMASGRLETSAESKKAAVGKHSAIMGKLCDDCRSVFSDHYRIGQYEKEIAEIGSKLDELADAKRRNTEKKAETDAKIAKLDEKLGLVAEKVSALNARYNKTSREMAALESRISSTKADLAGTVSGKNPYAELFESNRKSIESETAALKKIEAKYKYLKFAEGVVSQETLRKFIISDLIGLLDNKIRTYLTKLGARYTVVFDSDMNYEFATEGGEYEFGNFSAGEEMRIMIATSFAFRDFMAIRNGLNSNIMVLDEYFDSAISDVCVTRIIDVLRDYVREYDQSVYVISHRSEASDDMFDNIVQVEKTNNISRISTPA